MKNAAVSTYQTYDFLGIFLSTLCGVHCIITPLLILYFPSLGESFQSPWVHTFLIGFAGWSFHKSVYSHYKFHRSKATLGSGLLGFAILLVVYFLEVFSHSDEHGHAGEGHHEESFLVYLAVTGAILLVTSHILNIRKCKCLSADGLCSAVTGANQEK